MRIEPCIRSGFCCLQAPCGFGEATSDSDNSCKFLGGKEAGEHFCMKYDEIMSAPPERQAHISPAFDSGCGSALNPRRQALIQIRRSQ